MYALRLESAMSQIHIIHENDDWTAPLVRALEARNLPYRSWFLDEGAIDLSEIPPEGIYYNRMSASSHTRDHRYAPEYTSALLARLERHGRQVFNGSHANQLEISKVGQYEALAVHGIRTPRTIAVIGKTGLIKAAQAFEGPFITKHNRAGKGLGVQLFRSPEALQDYVQGPEFDAPIDGITLLQQYIEAPQPYITRLEFIGQKFLYAVRVDTSGGFQLCPADACAADGSSCPISPLSESTHKFEIIKGFDHPLIARYIEFMKANSIHIAACEMIVDAQSRDYTYDVNMNTNYNQEAENRVGLFGMQAIADYLGAELEQSVSGVTRVAS